MEAYAIYLHLELLEAVPKRGAQRIRIMTFIRSLSRNPHTPGDFIDLDETGRTARSRSLVVMRSPTGSMRL